MRMWWTHRGTRTTPRSTRACGRPTPRPTPAATWDTRATPLVEGTDVLISADGQTLSVRVSWAALGGCPTALRLVAHVVHGTTGNEWKDLAPTTHTPWLAPGGGYYEIDLT